MAEVDEKLYEMAAEVLGVSIDEARKNSKAVSEIDGLYLWNPMRGGLSMLVNGAGEKLVATSAVNYKTHLNAFLDGKRN